MSESDRWHVSQYVNGELVAHNVYTSYESAYGHIVRQGLLSGTNVLTKSSHCECHGRMT